ncbi:MAG: HipA domain-containing protein [Endomicrobium sp.]|nr:HipA domain-containing protein [Endomicrobium sp.]
METKALGTNLTQELLANRDNHSKNFSFIYKSGKWQLSPVCDLVYREGFNGQHTTTILWEGDPKKEHIFKLAKEVGLNKKTYEHIFDEAFQNASDNLI